MEGERGERGVPDNRILVARMRRATQNEFPSRKLLRNWQIYLLGFEFFCLRPSERLEMRVEPFPGRQVPRQLRVSWGGYQLAAPHTQPDLDQNSIKNFQHFLCSTLDGRERFLRFHASKVALRNEVRWLCCLRVKRGTQRVGLAFDVKIARSSARLGAVGGFSDKSRRRDVSRLRS